MTPILVGAGAEKLSLFRNAFDSLMIINVLEHVQNVFSTLENVHNALKPGGILIFNDRWWNLTEQFSTTAFSLANLDRLYHPIRVHRSLIEHFISGYDQIYRETSGYAVRKHGSDLEGLYFIGRKK